MNLTIRQKLLLALTVLLLVTASLQQLYTRHALSAAANKEVARFETSVAEVQINGLKNWLDSKTTIVSSTKAGFAGAPNPKTALAQTAQAGQFDNFYIGSDQGQMITSGEWIAPPRVRSTQAPLVPDADGRPAHDSHGAICGCQFG